MDYVKCSYCNCEYKVDSDFLGKSIKCHECNNFFEVANLYKKKRKPTFEELAIAYGVITKDQMLEAVSILKAEERKGKSTSIGDILIEKEMAKPDQVRMLREINNYMETRLLDKKFGRIAMNKGFLTEREVKLALSVQAIGFKKNKYCRLIGDILIESGVMNRAQKDIILEEQKRVDQDTPKNKALAESTVELGFFQKVKNTIAEFRSMSFKEFFIYFTKSKALIGLSIIILVTIVLFVYASTLKPKHYKQIEKDGIIDKMVKHQKTYQYPFEFSTTLSDSAFFRLELDIVFHNLDGFEEIDKKLDILKHAFYLVFAPRLSYQVKTREEIPKTLMKIFNSQLDVRVSKVIVNEYILSLGPEAEPVVPRRNMPDFSFE